MWSWQAVVRGRGPWARPLMTMPHVPQIPSRQSWSKAIGSSPFADQPLVDDVEHLEERHVRADVAAPRRSRTGPPTSRPSAARRSGDRGAICPSCSSARARWTFSNVERLDVPQRLGLLARRRCTPRPRRGRSSRRRAGPRRPASGTPRGSGRRTTRRARRASRHISSPSSRKSATRPAFSSDWLSSSPLAEDADVLPELLAQARDLARAPSSRPASCAGHAAVLPHRSCRARGGTTSTVRLPLIDSSCFDARGDRRLRRRGTRGGRSPTWAGRVLDAR